jgi:hypothetical protein
MTVALIGIMFGRIRANAIRPYIVLSGVGERHSPYVVLSGVGERHSPLRLRICQVYWLSRPVIYVDNELRMVYHTTEGELHEHDA